MNFQFHLWIGLLLTLYAVVIGLTGSILVFRVQLEQLTGPKGIPGGPQATVEQVLSDVQTAYPRERIISLATPTPEAPFYLTTIQNTYGRKVVRSNPHTGVVVGLVRRRRTWLDVVSNLHETWLFGIKGRVANGVGAALLLALNLTGLVIWWPGTKLWRRGLIVNFRRTWRRINYDLHRAMGFWALTILSIWAISGIYFGWPKQSFQLVNRLSPIVSAQPPAVHVIPVSPAIEPSISKMIASAQALDPNTTFAGLNFPYSRRAPFEILMLRGHTGREYTDTLYFNPWDGSHMATWRYGVNQSLGDWIIWSQIPLHFGTFWGLGVQILWAALGLTVPVLAITGAVMYWNRVLRHAKRAMQ